MRGCALRGRVSRKQGRGCIERVGMYLKISNRLCFLSKKFSEKLNVCLYDKKIRNVLGDE
jgi:hypothetical protein